LIKKPTARRKKFRKKRKNFRTRKNQKTNRPKGESGRDFAQHKPGGAALFSKCLNINTLTIQNLIQTLGEKSLNKVFSTPEKNSPYPLAVPFFVTTFEKI
jgi:hypothetical protein